MKKKGPEIDWEQLLEEEGMPPEPIPEKLGKRVRLGDGLGRKSDREEDIEDSGKGHSEMCPIKLGVSLTGELNQPNERPVEGGE